jgi:hypothetical protein
MKELYREGWHERVLSWRLTWGSFIMRTKTIRRYRKICGLPGHLAPWIVHPVSGHRATVTTTRPANWTELNKCKIKRVTLTLEQAMKAISGTHRATHSMATRNSPPSFNADKA